ncbi:hypothetical protein [Amycolatopsis sp. A1MSW2902]|uniref:hypothetical protein n=1 Tax=Amycolatopsis sp. A1MSW2902 TaxID=687413 RepID=UPI00307EF4D7
MLADLPDRGEQGDSAAEKIQMLTSDPVLKQLGAVRAGRFVTVPGPELEATVHSVKALTVIGDGLEKLG